jgi:hypothetical protein
MYCRYALQICTTDTHCRYVLQIYTIYLYITDMYCRYALQICTADMYYIYALQIFLTKIVSVSASILCWFLANTRPDFCSF